MSNERPIIQSDEHLNYSKAYHWIMRRKELTHAEKLIYIRLRNITHDCGIYEVSINYLAYECCVNEKTVDRAIKKLEKFGLISKIRNGKKMYNHYRCHIHEWMTDSNKFIKSDSANPRLTESERSKCPITESERTICPVVKGQNVPSIYKEQNKKQNNIVHPSLDETKTRISLFTSRFEKFWEEYPRKEKKKAAIKVWQKLTNGKVPSQLAEQIINDVIERKKNCKQWQNLSFVPLPTTYLNGEMWNDSWIRENNENSLLEKIWSGMK